MAAPIYNMARGFFAYTSDDTNVYNIGTTLENGTINSASPVAADANPAYPRGFKPRKILGSFVDSGKTYRTHVPIVLATNALWVGGTNTFTKGGQSFNVQGRIGERRTHKGG